MKVHITTITTFPYVSIYMSPHRELLKCNKKNVSVPAIVSVPSFLSERWKNLLLLYKYSLAVAAALFSGHAARHVRLTSSWWRSREHRVLEAIVTCLVTRSCFYNVYIYIYIDTCSIRCFVNACIFTFSCARNFWGDLCDFAVYIGCGCGGWQNCHDEIKRWWCLVGGEMKKKKLWIIML